MEQLIKEGKYSYCEVGEGKPLIILHGLMGGLSNFEKVVEKFSNLGYKIIIPQLPIYDLPLLKTTVKGFAKFLNDFIEYKGFDKVILLGNSLGGHIGLLYTKLFPSRVRALVLTGSSGLYENAMGGSYPRRGDYEYIKRKCEDVFYDPKVATQDIIDSVFNTVNDRRKLVKTLAISKSAIRHNMAKDLPNINIPVCLIWGKNDGVTPPEVAIEFDELLPNSTLYWIEKCGHAPMMEQPQEFNTLLEKWFKENNI